MNKKEINEFIEELEAVTGDELSAEEISIMVNDLNLPDSIEGPSPYQIPSGQPYRLSDVDDFPTGTYISNQTGKVVGAHFRISDELRITQEAALDIMCELGFKEIHTRDWYGVKSHTSSKTYEKRIGSDLHLVTISNIVNKWNSKVSQSYRKSHGVDVNIFSTINDELYKKLSIRFTEVAKKRKEESNNIGLVIQTPRGYSTTSFELPKGKLDIELNYGKKFKPIHDKIINTLNQKNGKGLVLLHGTPGTGKTHYLKYLASKIKDKRVLFIPPYLADFITSPEMTPFLIDNSNSILFIEDAERVITDRQVGGANGVSNILNITDGILSDILKIQIVATFNMDKAKIDSALLRKGRLIAEHKFDALPVEDSNLLLESLGKQPNATKPMTLTEIYNVEEEEFKSEDKYSPIGFNVR